MREHADAAPRGSADAWLQRTYAEVSLVPKMAESPAQTCIEFLDDLAVKRARPYAERDWAELRAVRRHRAGPGRAASRGTWPTPREKLRQQRYSFSDDEVKQYFPEPKVLEGPVRRGRTLFVVSASARRGPRPGTRTCASSAWSVAAGRAGRASSTLDLYAREGKRGGAWMDDARAPPEAHNGSVQTPVAYLTCNFSAAGGDGKPALLHARRSHHAVPRVRPRPAPHADAGRRPRRVRHQRRGVGCGGTAVAVHGELLLGMGRCWRR